MAFWLFKEWNFEHMCININKQKDTKMLLWIMEYLWFSVARHNYIFVSSVLPIIGEKLLNIGVAELVMDSFFWNNVGTPYGYRSKYKPYYILKTMESDFILLENNYTLWKWKCFGNKTSGIFIFTFVLKSKAIFNGENCWRCVRFYEKYEQNFLATFR